MPAVKRTPESIAKQVATARANGTTGKGRPKSAAHRAAISAAKKGQGPSAATIAALRRPETIAKRAASRRARNGAPSYFAVHQRTEQDRGRASSYPCAHCCRRAVTWAFRHDTPPVHVLRHERGWPYSRRTDDYVALCSSCHWFYDNDEGKVS